MPEITTSELKKLRALEARIATANDSLADVRLKRNEFRAAASAAKRELRQAERDSAKLEKMVTELLKQNETLSEEVQVARRDVQAIAKEATALRGQKEKLSVDLGAATKQLSAAQKAVTVAERAKARVEKQLLVVNDKLDGKDAPEITPDQLSVLLSDFVTKVSGQTGLEVDATELNLRVGFTGRGGGAFVIPSAGMDRDNLPELHDVKIDLTRGLNPVED